MWRRDLRLVLLSGGLAALTACSPGAAGLAPRLAAERPRPPLLLPAALTLPIESGDAVTSRERLSPDDAPMPDITGRWTGVWSGYGVLTRRVSLARAELSQAGRWGWGTIVLSDTLAADVPVVVTRRGALGVPIVFDVFPPRVIMKHASGGSHLSAVFRIDGDRMLGALRGHDTLIVLSRDR